MRHFTQLFCCILAALFLTGCAQNNLAPATSSNAVAGNASWYGKGFQHRRTTSGERYNMYAMTAAHRTLPLNTRVEVTNLKNGRTVVVRINDRGPFIKHRDIDLSYAAAKQLNMVSRGVAPVSIKVI